MALSDDLSRQMDRWLRMEMENENLRAVIAALILRDGGGPLTLSQGAMDAAAYWQVEKGIRIQILLVQPPLHVRVDLLAKEDADVTW